LKPITGLAQKNMANPLSRYLMSEILVSSPPKSTLELTIAKLAAEK
jgi:hypothetical protein